MNRYLLLVIFSPGLVFFYCEYLIYFFVQSSCDWPKLPQSNQSLRALILADTHLLGPYRGHWFDKLRREWQMSMSWLAANTLHSPDVVFFLGDIFDEGKWANQKQYEHYVERFKQMFPANSPHHVLVGNHDVGFHYMMDGIKLNRFYKTFNLSSSDVLRLGGITFVTINSMAMEGDGCSICKEAEKRINSIASSLKDNEKPILLQHFPLFRKSDAVCEGEDSMPDEEKHTEFRPKLDCLSRTSSIWLLKSLKPRVVFSGHTHHSCVYNHSGVTEFSVPSFSWRNRNNPSYFLVTISPDEHAVFKCFMPQESTVIRVYTISLLVFILTSLLLCYRRYRTGHIKML
ncbi:metallophosphoesterase 1 isoform X1 [Daphnia magna]|uniref:Metallophosphoesterase 1 n=2 Tax=Daphnia magna TaxID=35525 RepID=A0A0P5ZSE6_9CRUS|nr:metallophosphoesterase 1 isoform X1 [Daphnia magna]KZS21114.1 Metallophosphoesterase 1 [Daphnia magna]